MTRLQSSPKLVRYTRWTKAENWPDALSLLGISGVGASPQFGEFAGRQSITSGIDIIER